MSSSVWRAFQAPPDSACRPATDNQPTFFIPGYGDCRRRRVRRRRCQRSFQKSHLDMYLDDSLQQLQQARLGDLWSITSSAWMDADRAPDRDSEPRMGEPRMGLAEATPKQPAAADADAASAAAACVSAGSSPPGGLEAPASSGTDTSTSTTSASTADNAKCLLAVAAPVRTQPPRRGSQAVCGAPAGKAGLEASKPLNMPQLLLHVFLGCLVLLPLLWAAQQLLAGGRRDRSALMDQLRLWACSLFIPLFLYLVAQLVAESWAACTALLHFPDPAAEARFAAWFAAWTWPPDAALLVVWIAASFYSWSRAHLAAPSPTAAPSRLAAVALGPAAPAGARWLAAVGLLLPPLLHAVAAAPRTGRGWEWQRRHELVMVAVKLGYAAVDACITAAAVGEPAGALPQPQAAWQCWVALAPLAAAALLQARLSALLPTQLLHAVVVLLGPHGKRSVLHAAQVVGLGLCLPTLWLYTREYRARKRYAGLGLLKQPHARPPRGTPPHACT